MGDISGTSKKSNPYCEKGSVTRIDSCPYKLWKTLATRFKEAKREEREGFDIIETLTTVYIDISRHGVDKEAGFAQG